jgi:hypothetical protein
VISKFPGLELTRFFEQISGSDDYKEECERLRREKDAADMKTKLLFAEKRQALAAEKENEKKMKEVSGISRVSKES